MKKQDGYILIFTALIISAMTLLITYIFNKGLTYITYQHLVTEREKAKMLAFSGIEIARAQLSYRQETKKEVGKKDSGGKKENKSDPKSAMYQDFLTSIITIINRPQQIVFDMSKDNFEGMITLTISCEDGKINLNKVYDFKKHKFINEGAAVGDWRKIVELACAKAAKTHDTKDFFASLSEYLKKQQQPLEDVTQLMTIPEFATFKEAPFYTGDLEQNKKFKPVCLQDLFTLYSSDARLQPWLLSDALLAVLDLTRPAAGDAEKRLALIKGLLKGFSPQVDWKTAWNNQLKSLYGKELQSLPKGIDSVFNGNFMPKTFSVFVTAKVGRATQKVCVFIERVETGDQSGLSYDCVIKKWYWL